MTMSSPAAWQSSTPVDSAGYWDTTTRYTHILYVGGMEPWYAASYPNIFSGLCT